MDLANHSDVVDKTVFLKILPSNKGYSSTFTWYNRILCQSLEAKKHPTTYHLKLTMGDYGFLCGM